MGPSGRPAGKAQDQAMNKLKILDVKIVQQSYKRVQGAEVLNSTRVFDGTGKKELDQANEEVAALLYDEH